MSYSKTQWTNGQTPVDATNLNKIEDGIFGAHTHIEKLQTSHNLLMRHVRTWGPTFDPSTGHVKMIPIVQEFNAE